MNFYEQIIKEFSQGFSDHTKLKKAVADKIIKMIVVKSKDLDNVSIEDFGIVLNNLKSRMRMGIDMTALLNKAKDDEIEAVIDELIMFRTRDSLMAKSHPCEDFSEPESSVWLFEEMLFADKNLKSGDTVEIQIMREGKWKHPLYGEVVVTKKTLKDVKKHFDSRERGIDLAVDENHESNHKALGWFKELFFKGTKDLFAKIEITKQGAKLLNEGAYKYFSPEIVFSKVDEESGKSIKNLLIGGAFTNRPFFKAMKALMASEESDVAKDSQKQSGNSSSFALSLNNIDMKKFLAMLASMGAANNFNEENVAALKVAFSELSEDDKSPELVKMFEEATAETPAKTPEEIAADQKTADEKVVADQKVIDDKAAADKAAADQKTDDTPAEDTPVVQANEDGTKTVQMSESFYESLKKNAATASKLVKEAKFREVTDKVDGLVFSEENKVGIALPKDKNRISAFAAGLSDAQCAEFFSIVGNLSTVAASEMGSSNPGTSEVFKDEEVQYLVKNMNFTEDEAKDIIRKEKQ